MSMIFPASVKRADSTVKDISKEENGRNIWEKATI